MKEHYDESGAITVDIGKVKIPSYDECYKKKDKNPLEEFVFYYAPTGGEDVFAQNLAELLGWHAESIKQNTSA